MGESHVTNLKLLLLCFLHYSSISQNGLSLKPHNLNCCGCLLVTVCLDRIFVPIMSSMLDHLTPPRGKLIKTQLFGKQHFKGFCENFLFLILPRICSQKIKDSQSILKKIVQSSWFLLHEAKKKGGSLYPTFPYHRVCLIETKRTIYMVTSKGQLHFLTSGQGQKVA